MAGLFPGSGPTSETSLSSTAPATPPHTPARNQKRRLERSDSPASSIHPAETSSPAKKAAKRLAEDSVKVEELVEGDVGYLTDLDVVYPEELEEMSGASGLEDDDATDSDRSEMEGGLSRHMSRLHCADEERETERRRKERHAARRQGSRLFKRSHSQSVTTDAMSDTTNPDALPDQDLEGTRRRLRRRVRGPRKGGSRTSPGVADTGSEASRNLSGYRLQDGMASESDVMDVDGEDGMSGAVAS
ncbi:hypothetical protein MBLNU230_g8326t1 [Neophaeotheca triangularis]